MNRRVYLASCLAATFAGCRARTRTRQEHEIVVGTDPTYPPFEFVNEQGQISGVSVEIGKAISQVTGKPLVFRRRSFEGLIPALQSGQIDLVISSLTASEQRRQSIDFSDPYVKTGLSILAARTSPIETAADLKVPNRRIAVRIGTTGEQWCRQELPDAQLVSLDTDAACVMEVVNATVDAWVYDQISILNYHAKHRERTRALLAPLREEVWAVGVKKGRDELRSQVNAALATMKQQGAFKKIADKYLAKERDLMRAQGLPFVFE